MSEGPDLFRFRCGHEIPIDQYMTGEALPYCVLCPKPKKN